MRSLTAWATLATLVGCSGEYNVGNKNGTGVGTTTGTGGGGTGTSTTDQTPPTGTDPVPEPPGDPLTPRDENEVVERSVQPTEFYVDVLFVVDNSGSMEDNQDALATAFPTFIDYFEAAEGILYQIGVVSTDVEDPGHSGKLREAGGLRWLDNGTPNKAALFGQMAMMGTDGSGEEAGRAAVHHAITTELTRHNAGFFRPDASLATIVISDENDDSSVWGVPLPGFIDEYRAFKPDPAMVSFSTIIGPVPNGCATADPGFEYPDVRAAVGGAEHSICDADWDRVLEDLASVALSGRREFFLSEIPEVETLEVQVIEADGSVVMLALGTDFTYDPVRNSVTLLSYTPGPLAEVYVRYTADFGAGW